VMKREWIALQANVNPLASSGRPVVRSDIQHMLPTLSENADILTLFKTLEHAMLLNNVDKVDWPRYLPAQMNSKADKVVAGFTLQENRDFDTYKSTVQVCTMYHQAMQTEQTLPRLMMSLQPRSETMTLPYVNPWKVPASILVLHNSCSVL